MSIEDKAQNLIGNIRVWKARYAREIAFLTIIFLVALLSFGLGYLANRELSHAPIVIEQNSSTGE